ncbi:MAG: hypothetical protein RL172_456 [Bacteroidota bacterium]
MILKKGWLLVLVATVNVSISMAQQANNYPTQWKKIAGYEKKGLTKSALQAVTSLYQQALKDNNTAQQVKSIVYQLKYRRSTQEEPAIDGVMFLDGIIKKSKAPVINILQSIQATLLWEYLQQNRWRLYGRTNLDNERNDDISTWGLKKLYSSITQLYQASLDVKTLPLLQRTGLNVYEAILLKGENTRHLRPTLYDLLAHRALLYFTTGENDLTQAANQFTITDTAAFAPANQFINHRFNSTDSTSLHFTALQLYQDILRFHLADAQQDARLDADIARLSFVYNYAAMAQKNNLYLDALHNLEQQTGNHAAATQASYLRAKYFYDKGKQFDAHSNTSVQYEIKKAKELAEVASKKFPESEGAVNALNLLHNIGQPALSLQTELVNLPGQPFRSLVKYQNVPVVYFRLIKISRQQLEKLEATSNEQQLKTILQLNTIRHWQEVLPDPADYQPHAVEVKIDAVEKGIYLLMASMRPGFETTQNIICQQLLHVSNISYTSNYNNDYYVLHRDSGLPMQNSKIQVWQSNYDFTKKSYQHVKAEVYTSDKNGHFKLNDTEKYRSIYLDITNGDDELFLNKQASYSRQYNFNQEPEYQPSTMLFTDRAIYRPGQTVYFKGIVFKQAKSAGNSKVLPGYHTILQLYDANSQPISQLTVTSNSYGSFSGSFTLPKTGLTGNFSLVDSANNATHYFVVEEYKRPKFSVSLTTPAGSYRVNDSITVSGIAKAYAGNAIDAAKVTYRVMRRIQYPVWLENDFLRPASRHYGPMRQTVMAHGVTTTNSDGSFNIPFIAIPDEFATKKDQPIFYYEITADVTDINGETQTTSTSMAVAYQALQLSIQAAEQMPADSLQQVMLTSTNSNGIFEPAEVTLTIQALDAPKKIFRDRYWEVPDQFVMSKETYYEHFPYDVYKNENNIQQWNISATILQITDSTRQQQPIKLVLKNNEPATAFLPGWYKIIASTTDKYGEVVKAEKFILLTSNNADLINQPMLVNSLNSQAAPGEKIQYSLSTCFDKIFLIHTVSRNKADNSPADKSLLTATSQDSILNSSHYFLYKNKPLQQQLDITETDRGGLAMSYVFVQHNRIYNGSKQFDIPWTNKSLNITYQTFRNKLLPGQQEKWTVKLTGPKGDKVAAEMLAAMYDASLDQFVMHQWKNIAIWPVHYSQLSWADAAFTNAYSYNNNLIENNQKLYNKTYDALIDWIDETDDGYVNSPVSRRKRDLTGAVSRVQNDDIEVAATSSNGDAASASESEIPEANKITIDAKQPNPVVSLRKNFNETAFFFPDLTTDTAGNISFSTTLPEALTEWKLLTLAHTKNLASGYAEKKLVTQKPLMVQPNNPRFIREGDQLELTAKIVNMGDSELTGTATLELLDAATDKPVDGWFNNVFPSQYFTIAAGQSNVVKFPVQVPFNFNSALTCRVMAGAGSFSDGEETAIPVFTNRTLVTESLPIYLNPTDSSREFNFTNLTATAKTGSSSLVQHALTVEYSSNPAWYAVQALPYLMQYPYDCAEQTFNRYYANLLAAHTSQHIPRIKEVFNRWKNTDSTALLSNLQKNQELKNILLQESPWVLEAQNETLQKRNIALLFDLVKTSDEATKSLAQLQALQTINGGFAWFKGGPDDWYITQYILTGIGHLIKLGVLPTGNNNLTSIIGKAIPYLDKKIKESYDILVKQKNALQQNNLSATTIQYLYMRSFFKQYPLPANAAKAIAYYQLQAKKYWLQQGICLQAMIALAAARNGDIYTAAAIIQSLQQKAIVTDDMGMYWKEWNQPGWFWHQAPIESQALMIEAFNDIKKDPAITAQLTNWLLQQKQTQHWATTKATAEACYALLITGSQHLLQEKPVVITLGDMRFKNNNGDAEAGSGYFKKVIAGPAIKPAMGNIKIAALPAAGNTAAQTASWGSVYWQYFEDLDKINNTGTPLKLTRQLLVEKNTASGPVLYEVEDGGQLKVGDKVKVRIVLLASKDMEYVHMKDMRAACMEPLNVLSGYQYQNGLSYYQSTKDASTHFFFNWIKKGTYVFEYPLYVTHAGNFSNGITTIQCMYAPAFSSHSQGIRVQVE